MIGQLTGWSEGEVKNNHCNFHLRINSDMKTKVVQRVLRINFNVYKLFKF